MRTKKMISMLVILTMIPGILTGCSSNAGNDGADTGTKDSAQQEDRDVSGTEDGAQQQEDRDASGMEETEAQGNSQSSESNVLIAYFSMPEDIEISGIDADAGASVVVREGEALGNVQYMAQTIQEAVGGDLFRIETTEQYPLDHDPLVDQAAEEQDEDIRPELSTHIENPKQYDTILLGFPNWWGDMPQALYTFLEEYDFSGKTIIPFCPHGGSGFSRTESTIARLQPQADVSSNGLSISRNDVADSADEVTAWARGLGIS